MDRERFDALTRLCATSASRRATLAAVLGAGLGGAVHDAGAEGQRGRRKSRRRGGSGRAVVAEATCATPGPSANLNGCNFNDAEFAGIDLSSSAMKGTKFRRADLCGADLSSANLKNADFRNADLTNADLHSSACNGANFAGATFCNTIGCNGTVINPGCVETCEAEPCVGNEICGSRPGGGALRCCDGVCPTPTSCLSGGEACGPTSPDCLAQCCSENAGGNPGSFRCETNLVGPCESDLDCDGVGGAQCRCGRCCVLPGRNGICPSGSPFACCSGACNGFACA